MFPGFETVEDLANRNTGHLPRRRTDLRSVFLVFQLAYPNQLHLSGIVSPVQQRLALPPPAGQIAMRAMFL